ncbi:MAG: phosphoribosyltransferase [Caldilineaceae bacterium]|nr:phosphoribosyltransferase [Caldilineaceae bacterium]
MMQPLFQDRFDAGRKLASKLEDYHARPNVVVLALPRGGVPVAFEVANSLNAALDIFLVRKLGVPGHEELAMGAIASGGVLVLNEAVVEALEIPRSVIDAVAKREQQELARREQAYRAGRPVPDLRDKTVILVDDGLATGSTMAAAVSGVRAQGAAKIVVAVPTAAPETCDAFEEYVDAIICAETPQPFFGVGMWYANFEQTSDKEVRALLARAATMQEAAQREGAERETAG